MLTTLVFLAILTTAVFVHELAHYLNARSVGLPVRAFSIGMGPVIYRKYWRGTEWRVSLLPIGGYVDIPGMASTEDQAGQLQHPTEGFATKTLGQKLWVLVGGVIANYLLAILLLATVITLEPGYRSLTAGIDPVVEGAEIAAVMEGMPAESLGLQAGDVIIAINETENPNPQQVTQVIASASGRLELRLQRGDEALTIATDWPPATDERPLLGIQIAPLVVEPPPSINYALALAEATTFSLRIVPEAVQSFAKGFASVMTGRRAEEIAGPVGIVTAIGQAARVGIVPVLALAALINLSLAIFNLLPIPGLDGGRMLLATIVAVRGKPFRPGQEEFIHFLGIMTVLVFMVLITFNELSGLFRS